MLKRELGRRRHVSSHLGHWLTVVVVVVVVHTHLVVTKALLLLLLFHNTFIIVDVVVPVRDGGHKICNTGLAGDDHFAWLLVQQVLVVVLVLQQELVVVVGGVAVVVVARGVTMFQRLEERERRTVNIVSIGISLSTVQNLELLDQEPSSPWIRMILRV